MAIDLSDSEDRLTRAEKLLTELNNEIHAYAASNPISIDLVPYDGMITSISESGELILTPDPYGQTDKEDFLVLRASIVNNQPTQINIILGDIVNNIKTCYDYIAQSIGKAIGMSQRELRKVQYPSTKSESDVDSEIQKYFKNYVSFDEVKKIKITEPYFNGRYNIKEITELCNLNKHRKPISFISCAGGFPVVLGNSLSIGDVTLGIDPIIGYADIIQIHKNSQKLVKYTQPQIKVSIDFRKINVTTDQFDTPAYDYISQSITHAKNVIKIFK